MLSVLATVLFILVSVNAVALGDPAASLSKWETLVDKTVKELRNKRSIDPEPEYHIASLQYHYTSTFKDMNNRHQASIQEDRYGAPAASMMSDTQAPVNGRYIVLLNNGVSEWHLDETVRILEQANYNSNGRLVAKHIKPFRTLGKGFTATIGEKMLAILQDHPEKFSIEQDMALKRHDHHQQEVGQLADKASSAVPWNLDRLDQHSGNLNGHYNPSATGEGVDVYVLDTGIRYTHHDLEGRAKYAGYDAIDDLTGTKQNGDDCNSHGTHCAGTVGGKVFGVAKKVTLHAARVLDCTGTGAVSGIIHMMEYIVNKRKNEGITARAVFSMSLGVEKSEGFNNAANIAAEEGIVVVSASGNQGKDSCDYSPGSAAKAISVAASDIADNAVLFSNLGKCVTVFAPGAEITSASNKCDTCTVTKSGTSMACPHAAGLAAIVMSLNPSYTSEEVKNAITQKATKNVIQINRSFSSAMSTGIQDKTPNLLLYVPSSS